jgi:alkylhydroperoxidase family enzyme
MTSYLAPIEKPRGVRLRLLAMALRRVFGRTPGWLTVFSSRMPFAFTMWMGKVSQLNKKLTVGPATVALVRARVDFLNACPWCQDAGRWYINKNDPGLMPKLDALADYQASGLFSAKERAALDFATELTQHKHVSPDTMTVLRRHYSEREICEIVWLVSSNHLMNLNNLGLGIGSDGLCDLAARKAAARHPVAR